MNIFEHISNLIFKAKPKSKKKVSKRPLHLETVEVHDKKHGNYVAKRWKKNEEIPIRGLEHGQTTTGTKRVPRKPKRTEGLPVSGKNAIRDGLRVSGGDGTEGKTGVESEQSTINGGVAEQRPRKLKIKIKKPKVESPVRDANNIHDGAIPPLYPDTLLAEDQLKHNHPTPDSLTLNVPSLLELKNSIDKNNYPCTVENKLPVGVYKKPEGMIDSDWDELKGGKRPFLLIHNHSNKTKFLAVNTNKKGKDIVQLLKVTSPRKSNPSIFEMKLSYASKAVLTVPDLFKKIFGHSPVLDGDVEKAKEKINDHISEKADADIKAKAEAILKRVGNSLNTEDYQTLKRYEENGGQIPKNVIKKAWEIISPYFSDSSKILDPASGIGSWAEGKTKEYRFTLCDTDPKKTEIAKILYPGTVAKNGYFEEMFLNRLGKPEKEYKGEKFDGAVGNPPTGSIADKYKGVEGKGYTRYEDYFLSRSLDTVKEGGIVAMFVPSTFLSKGGVSDKSKQKVLDRGELIDAYRFPEGSFPNEKMSLDLVILRKNTTTSKDNSLAYSDKYFKQNKDKIFGNVVQKTNTKKKVVEEVRGDISKFLGYTPREGVFKTVTMTEEHKRKIAESMQGNQNALGHHGNGREPGEEEKKGKKKKNSVKEQVFRVAGETITKEEFIKKYQSHIDPIDLKNHEHLNHLGQYDMSKVQYDKDHTLYHKGNYYPKYLYESGNITDKLIDLAEYDKEELIKKHGIEAYEHQLKILKSKLPKEIKLSDIKFNPLEPFAENHMIGEGNAWYLQAIQEKDALGVIGDKLKSGFIRGRTVSVDARGNESGRELNLFDTDVLGSLVLVKNENFETQGRQSRRGRNNEVAVSRPNENDYSIYLAGETVQDPDGEMRQKLYPVVNKVYDAVHSTIPDRAIGLQIMKDLYENGMVPYPQDLLLSRKEGESMEKFKARLEKEFPGNFIIPSTNKLTQVVSDIKKFNGDLNKHVKERRESLLDERLGEAIDEPMYHKKSLKEAFVEHINSLSAEAVLNLGVPKAEVLNYLNGNDITSRSDMTAEERQQMAHRRKQVSESLFSTFIDELPESVKANIAKEYNHIFNSHVPVDGSKVPISVSDLGKKFKGYDLVVKEKQYQNSARHLASGTGVDVAEVGVGKTMIGILTTVANMQSGGCKRPLIVVPANLLGKWEYEINQIFPTIKVNKLGTAQVNDFLKNNKSGVPYEPEDGSITIMSSSVFEGKFRLSKEVQDELTKDIGDDFPDPNEGRDTRKPDSPESKMCLIDKAGFDSLTVDEAHKMNKILFNTDEEKKRWGRNEFPDVAGGEGSKVGRKLFLTARHITKNNNNKNVLLLTATPTTNNPLELYSLLSVVKKDQLERMGIRSSKDFLNTFAETSIEYVPVANEVGIRPKTVVRGYKNAKAFRNLVQGVMIHTTGEDAKVERPASHKEVVSVPETPLQKKQREQMQEIYGLSAESGRGEYALMSIQGQRMNNMSPHLIGRDTRLAEVWDELLTTRGNGEPLPPEIKIPEYLKNGLVEKAIKENFNSKSQAEKKKFMDDHHITDGEDFSNSVKHNIISDEHYLASKIVRDSNKTRFALDTVGELYNQHKKLTDIPMSGQIIFVPLGLKVPGHEKFKTMDCYKKYISERHGVPLEAIGVMDASPDMKKGKKDENGEEVTKWDEMVKNYNDPNHPLKIIIGSDVINEGVDLNGCTMVAHNLAPDWNPTAPVQKEGRGRRQGNRWNLFQFLNYVTENSVDSVLLQKNGEKTDRINSTFQRGEDAPNFIDTSDVNPDDIKTAIIRDPHRRATLESEKEAEERDYQVRLMGSKVQKVYSVMEDIANSHKAVQQAYDNLDVVEQNKRGLSPNILASEINKAKNIIRSSEKKYENQIARMKNFKPSYEPSENDFDFSSGNERNIDALKELSLIAGNMQTEYNKAQAESNQEKRLSFEKKFKEYKALEEKRAKEDQSANWEMDEHYNKLVKNKAKEIIDRAMEAGHKHERLADGKWKTSFLALLGFIPNQNPYRTLITGYREFKKSNTDFIAKSFSLMDYIFKAKKGSKLDKSKLVMVRKIVHKPNKKPFPQSFWVSPDKVDKYIKEGYHIAENSHLVKHNLKAEDREQVHIKPEAEIKKPIKEKKTKPQPPAKVKEEPQVEEVLNDDNFLEEKVSLDKKLEEDFDELNEELNDTVVEQEKALSHEKAVNPQKFAKKPKVKSRDFYVMDLPYVSPKELASGLNENTIINPHIRITQNEYANIYHSPDINVRITWLFRVVERISKEHTLQVNHHGQRSIKYAPSDLDGFPKYSGIFKKLVRDVLKRHVDDDGLDRTYQNLLNALFNMSQDPLKFRNKLNEVETPPETLHLWLCGFIKNAARNFKKMKAIDNTTIVKDAQGNTVFDEFGNPMRMHHLDMGESEKNRLDILNGLYSPSAEESFFGKQDEVFMIEKLLEEQAKQVMQVKSAYQMGIDFLEKKRANSRTTDRDLAIWEIYNQQKAGIGNHFKGKVDYKKIALALYDKGFGVVQPNILKNTLKAINAHVIQFNPDKTDKSVIKEEAPMYPVNQEPERSGEEPVYLGDPIKIVMNANGIPEAVLSDKYPPNLSKPEVITYFNKMSPFNKHAQAKLNKINTDIESMENPFDLSHFKNRGNIPYIMVEGVRDNKGGKASNFYKIYAFYKRVQDSFGATKQIVVYTKKVKMDNRDIDGKKIKSPPKKRGRKAKNQIVEVPIVQTPEPVVPAPTTIPTPDRKRGSVRPRLKEEKLDVPVEASKPTRRTGSRGKGDKKPVW